MKKLKLVAALVAAATPLLAHADVTVYGSIRAGLNTYKTAKTDQTTTGVDDYSSRIGFKGNEDLGNGLKAIWQVETGFAVDGTGAATGTSSGTFGNRTTFVGLEGNFGKIRLGYLDDVTSETEATDIWYDSRKTGFTFPLYEGEDKLDTFTDGRFKNSIRYDTPNLYGFTGILQYGADETAAAGKPKANRWGARLGYSNSGFFGAYAYQAIQNQGVNSDQTSSINRVEAGYDANNLYLAATYNWVKYFPGAGASDNGTVFGFNKLEGQSWAVTGAYTIGAFQPKVTYSQAIDPKVDGVKHNLDRKQFAVGVDYSLSKRSLVGLQYAQINYGDGYKTDLGWKGDKSNSVGVYMKHNF